MIPKFRFFTLRELFSSSTGSSLGLEPYCYNDESRIDEYMRKYHPSEYGNLVYLVRYFLDPIRAMFGKPILVTSSFRTLRLNVEVGGVPSSFHLHGCAFDLVCNDSAALSNLFHLLSLISKYNPKIKCLNYGKYLHLQFKLTSEEKDLAIGCLDCP